MSITCSWKICLGCKKEYKPTSNSQKLCLICRTIQCKGCSIKFQIKRLGGNYRPSFCNIKCFYTNRGRFYKCWSFGRRLHYSVHNNGKIGRIGEKNPMWRGGRFITKQGYVFIHTTSHPRAKRNRISEHTLVAEEKIGRPLIKNEIVHHINGKRDDNRPENLEVMTRAEHLRHHDPLKQRCLALGHPLSEGKIKVSVEEIR